MQGWPIKQLGLQQVLSEEFNAVAEFEIKQHKKKVLIRTDQYFEKGIQHQLIFITDVQNLLREEERQAWQKLLRVLSHEINNSIAPIASLGETLRKMVENRSDDPELDNDLKEGLGVITERAHSLNIFIQHYQKLAKLPLPTKSQFDLEPLVQSVRMLFSGVNFEINSKALTVYADKDQLQQVLVNLIKNAFESMHQNPQGLINIEWQTDNQFVALSILDQGSGIKNIDNLFVPFYTTKQQGTGIGLSLSRQIMVNHGGDLIIKNRTDCQGVLATLLIPN